MIGPSELSSDLMISATRQAIINFIDKNVTWTVVEDSLVKQCANMLRILSTIKLLTILWRK